MTRFLQIILFPIAICYGIIMQLRNWLFEFRILPVRTFPKPLISVGNLTYGGTGKTPHIEYLIRLLQPKRTVATLSRGYGRKTKGFFMANGESDARTIGDEPLQFFTKFNNLHVAVDENRCHGIQLLTEKHPETGVILLDDAYQHRYVKPGLSILLTDYHHLYSTDYLIPTGSLREFRTGAKRADIIIVTKTPKVFSPITRRRIMEELKPAQNQTVYFSYITYLDPVPVNIGLQTEFPSKITNILLFTGIANDYPLREHLERKCSELVVMKFADHHVYTSQDLKEIAVKFNDLPTHRKVLVTTEKDVMRLKSSEFGVHLKNLPLFCVPMKIDFHGTDKDEFERKILNYVEKN